jgi:hypothetical protein
MPEGTRQDAGPIVLRDGDARSPTNGFYEAMGAHRLYAAAGEFHGGYGWRDLHELAATYSRISGATS